MKVKEHNVKAFTFLELILYVAVLGILVSAVMFFIFNSMIGKTKSYIQQNVSQNARLINDKILMEIKNATNLVSVSPSSIEVNTSDPSRNPIRVEYDGKNVLFGRGTTGNCTAVNPCNLNDNYVYVSEFILEDLTPPGSSTKNIGLKMTVENLSGIGRKEWQFKQSYEGSVQIRSIETDP